MRVRAQDANGDYTFGQSAANFLVDSNAAVAQTVLTRLLLWEGEWFLDVTEGTPWLQQILGAHTKPLYDAAIQDRVLSTPGVNSIDQYNSQQDPASRALIVTMTISTQFGQVAVSINLNVPQAIA